MEQPLVNVKQRMNTENIHPKREYPFTFLILGSGNLHRVAY